MQSVDTADRSFDEDQQWLRRPVAALMTRAPQVVAPDSTLAEAAMLMRRCRISAVPVVAAGRFSGMLSEAMLLDALIAGGATGERAVASLSFSPAHPVEPDQPLFDALALMTRHAIAHVPVIDDERLVGVITQTDIVRQQTRSSLFLVMDIARSNSSKAMVPHARRIPALLGSLADGGASPEQIGQVATSVSGAITRRLIELAEMELGGAPLPYAWLACGSQGRREQLTVSDQDNCLVHADGQAHADGRGGGERPSTQAWFEAFAHRVCDGLDTVGYIYCPGGMMASNAVWRQPLGAWQGSFGDWVASGSPDARLSASVMADARCVAGNASLAIELKRRFTDTVSSHRGFCLRMLGDALSHRPALTAFGRLASERDGQGRERLELKRGGTGPIVDLARVHALAIGAGATGTPARLEAAKSSRGLSAASARDLADAYRTLSGLRVRHAGQPVSGTGATDHRIHLDTLSTLERDRLRTALVLVRDTQTMLARRAADSGF